MSGGGNLDPYLVELCANITRLQRAEIAWMSEWLENRGHKRTAPCEVCEEYTEPAMPCEDKLPSTSFCHRLGGDFMCKCETQKDSCDKKEDIAGFGVLDVTSECQRTCGTCPAERPPLFHTNPCMSGDKGHGDHGGHGSHGGHGDHGDHGDHGGHGGDSGHGGHDMGSDKGGPSMESDTKGGGGSHEGHEGHGQSSSELPAANGSSPAQKVVSMTLTMAGLSYDNLIANTTATQALETNVKASVLENLPTGYT